jgi:hypothetical protein
MAEEVPPPAEVQGWPVPSESGELCRLRRNADSLGLAVTKIPERSRWFYQYGPYMLTDPRSGYAIVASGLDLEEVEKWLQAHRHKSEQWWRDERDAVDE